MPKGNPEQARKYLSVSIRYDLVKRMRDTHQTLQPKMDSSGFLADLLDFYEKFHCPECGAVTAKKQRHEC